MESQWYYSYLLGSWMMITAIHLKILFSSGNKTADITSARSFQGTSEKHILQKSHIEHPNLIHMLFYNWHLHVRLEHATCELQNKFYSATILPDNLCSTMTIILWSKISTIAVALVAQLVHKNEREPKINGLFFSSGECWSSELAIPSLKELQSNISWASIMLCWLK